MKIAANDPRWKVSASLASSSMFSALEDWLADFIKQAANAIPKNLKIDGVRWVPMRRGYGSVEAKGYSKGDLEAQATIAVFLHGDGSGTQIYLEYKDVSFQQPNKEDFLLKLQEDPGPAMEKIAHYFANR